MAWVDILETALPAAEGRGQKATAPKVSVRDNGQIAFNSFIAEQMVASGLNRCIIRTDKENPKKLGIVMCDADMLAKFAKLDADKRPAIYKVAEPSAESKGNNKTRYVSASRVLRLIGYDYVEAGNQPYDAEIVKSAKGSSFMVVITLPAETPAKRPIVPRKKRTPAATATDAAVAVAAVAGVPTPVPATPATPATESDVDFD